MKKPVKKPRDLSLDELIVQIVRFQMRMEKHGAQIGFTMHFQPKQHNKPNSEPHNGKP